MMSFIQYTVTKNICTIDKCIHFISQKCIYLKGKAHAFAYVSIPLQKVRIVRLDSFYTRPLSQHAILVYIQEVVFGISNEPAT